MQVLSRQRGVSLIEVLVAIVIFSVGVLGLALLQLKGAQFTKESGSRSNAVIQARSLADAMRANPQAVQPADGTSSYYLYDGTAAPDPSTCSGNASCVRAKTDLQNFLAALRQSGIAAVGGPVATVTADTTLGTLTIKVSWNGLDTNGDNALTASDNGNYTFSFLP